MNATPPEPQEPVVRPFADFLREQDRGRTHDALSQQLHDLIAAVQETGKGGSIVLKIDVKPVTGTQGRTLTVTDQVTAKIPHPDRKSIFFVTDDGNLSRNDPQQPVITGLREVETTTPTQLRSAK